MAIYPTIDAQTSSIDLENSPQPINIESWTEQLNPVSLISPAAEGTSAALAIDLDKQSVSGTTAIAEPFRGLEARREPLRRDSLKRRDALLKGKEGSRRRTRWENDRLLNNPWAQPPLPSDYEIHPTYPKREVPYYLAPLWDGGLAARVEAEHERRDAIVRQSHINGEGADRVPRKLREKFKKAKAAKALLKDLEEQVRIFVETWEDQAKEEQKPELDSEDEEIVFVGRNGQMHDIPLSPKFETSVEESAMERDRLVFDSLANDQGASFGRWLVHSIASYYNLRTWSITVGDPARREAYVGMPTKQASDSPSAPILPRPLWAMV